ncbi:hypothetical protein F0562_027887 [Nyssa sinensis]|uniref:Uncharacterized protein n=1 Tax=Nyssa sinensis TaxID=561372 RepID=A0A5J5B6V9_9ASTE|nr:hypothetical protein F0562_027887 [Nyssa sinensis]
MSRGETSIHNTYSTLSWAELAEECEYIPQAPMDPQVEYRGFLEDPSFLMDFLHGGSSPPCFRGRAMHGGQGDVLVGEEE